MAEFSETVIDHVSGDEWCGVSTGEKRWATKLERFAKEYPNNVERIAENDDGSVYYHVPWDWVNIRRPKRFSEADVERKKAWMRSVGMSNRKINIDKNEPILRESTEVE